MMSNPLNDTSMKKLFFAMMMMLTASVSANAMSYEQARNEALFLTDKMAYELNLTDEQYEAAYEINLDYLMGVTSRYDVYGTYWERRNLDLSYILYDWQWNAFVAASYFYRPLYWDAGYWHFGIYARYPHRDYFYFGRPHFYHSYRGAHAWHRVGGNGYYHGHSSQYRHSREHFGMHDRWNRGDFRGGNRHSSTRVTGGDRGRMGRGTINRGGSIERRNPSNNRGIERRNNTIERRNNTIERNNRSIERSTPNRSVDGRSSQMRQRVDRSNSGLSTSRRSSTFSSGSRSSSSYSGGSRSSNSHSGSFSGGSRSSNSHSSTFSGGSRSSSSYSGGSFSGGSRSSSSHSGSFSGGSRSSSSHSGSFSGGSHSGGSRSGSFSGGSSHSHSGGGHSGGGHSGGMGGRR